MMTENLKHKIDNFLDLDTGICYTIRTRDGLIERVDNETRVNRKVRVESPNGDVKQLLNG